MSMLKCLNVFSPGAAKIKALNWVMEFEVRLNQMATYASLDATTFFDLINVNKKTEVMEKYENAKAQVDTPHQGSAVALQIGTDWDNDKLKLIHDKLEKSKAGICTTFAKAAAYIIYDGGNNAKAPLIEIVSYSNHVFVIVGRKKGKITTIGNGLLAKKKLADHKSWGKGWMLVDVWAGAMGYEKVIYKGTEDYPFPTMISKLNLIMTTQCNEQGN